MVTFYSWFYDLEYYGFFDIILPFLLVFSICFAIFDKLGIFGEKKSVSMIVSIVMAAFAVRNGVVVYIIQRFLPKVSLVLVVGLMFLVLAGLLIQEKFEFSGGKFWIALVFGLMAVVWALFYEFGYGMPDWMYDITTSQDAGMLLFIGVFILVIFLIVTSGGKGESIADQLSSALTKKK